VPPITRHKVDSQTESFRYFSPQHRELSGLKHQYPVSRRKRINNRSLPSAGAAGGVNKYVALAHPEDRFHALETLAPELGKLWSTVIDCGSIDGPKDSIRHIGRSRDLQKMPAGLVSNGRTFHRENRAIKSGLIEELGELYSSA
jgi:hypothetical protein